MYIFPICEPLIIVPWRPYINKIFRENLVIKNIENINILSRIKAYDTTEKSQGKLMSENQGEF